MDTVGKWAGVGLAILALLVAPIWLTTGVLIILFVLGRRKKSDSS